MKELIEQLISGENLTADNAHRMMHAMLTDVPAVHIAAALVLLQAKGVTSTELAGMVKALHEKMQRVDINEPVLDIVGTGGDGANTVNISTASSIVAASYGVKVAKHGGRAVSSQCGSANVLQQLGIKIDMNADQVQQCIKKIGIGFCFAPIFHPSWVAVKNIRAQLGVRTVFNILGPLVNPAYAKHMVLGVFSAELVPLVAQTLAQLNITHALVVHSQGLDELSLLGPTEAMEVTVNGISPITINPQDYGFKLGTLEDIRGGDAAFNAQLIRKALGGAPGPIADTIALNAGAGIYVAGQAATLAEGIRCAQQQLQSGKALHTLNNWATFSKGLSDA